MNTKNSSMRITCGQNAPYGKVEELPSDDCILNGDKKSSISINISKNYDKLKNIITEYTDLSNFYNDLSESGKDVYDFVSLLRNNSSFADSITTPILFFIIKEYTFKILEIVKNIIEDEKRKNESAKEKISSVFDTTLVYYLDSVCNKNIRNYMEILQDIDYITKRKDTETLQKSSTQICSVVKSCRNDIADEVYQIICRDSLPIINECNIFVNNKLKTMEFVEG